jgi:hypothetical protein
MPTALLFYALPSPHCITSEITNRNSTTGGLMKKLMFAAALGLLLCGPAFADTEEAGDQSGAGAVHAMRAPGKHHHAWRHHQCQNENDASREACYQRTGWNHRQSREWGNNNAVYIQEGQDLNSTRWADGSPRATLPPHNARGSERPAIDSDDGYWIRP